MTDIIEDDWDIEPRRPKGWLMADIENVLRSWEAGEVTPDDPSKPMTPHRTCDFLVRVEELDAGARPSSGAVHNIFKKWERCQYATFQEKPFAFTGFTQEGGDLGFEAMWQKYVVEGGPTLEELEKAAAEADAEAKRLEAIAEAFDAE